MHQRWFCAQTAQERYHPSSPELGTVAFARSDSRTDFSKQPVRQVSGSYGSFRIAITKDMTNTLHFLRQQGVADLLEEIPEIRKLSVIQANGMVPQNLGSSGTFPYVSIRYAAQEFHGRWVKTFCPAMNPSTVTARRFRHSGIPASYWIRRKSKRSWHMPICIIFGYGRLLYTRRIWRSNGKCGFVLPEKRRRSGFPNASINPPVCNHSLHARAKRHIIRKQRNAECNERSRLNHEPEKGNSAAAAGAVATLAILSIAVLVMVRKYGR